MAKNRSRFQQSPTKESTMDNNQAAQDQDNQVGTGAAEDVTQGAGDAEAGGEAVETVIETPKLGLTPEEIAQGNEDFQNQLAEVAFGHLEPVTIPAGQVLPPPAINDVDQLPLSCSASSNLSIEELKHYIEKMGGRVMMPADEGGQMQMNLYFTLVQIINAKAEDFDAVFGLAMKLIRDNLKGVFSDENMHRYTPHVSMPSQRVAHFRQLLSALTTLAVPETRPLAMRHNLANAFGRAPIREDSRQRVLNFFNI